MSTAAAAATPPPRQDAVAPPSERCVAEARGVLVAASSASSTAVVPDALLEPCVINEALAAVAPVVTLPLPTAAIVAAAATAPCAAAPSSRKRRRDDAAAANANPLASFLGTSLPPALRDALRLVGGLAHDYLSVPLPAWAGGDEDDEAEDKAAGLSAAAAADAALGWSVGGGSSSQAGRLLAVAADPLAGAKSLGGGGVAVPAASGAVLVFDVPAAALPPPAPAPTTTTRRARAAAATRTPATTSTPALAQPHAVLVHELQRRAGCVAWRPGRPNHLAVGCAGGAALWSLAARPPLAGGAPPPPPPPAALGPGAASAFCTFLRHRRRARVTSLAWSPDGRLLAGASSSSAALAVWDASMGGSGGGGSGGGARLRAALSSGLARLSWSPCGRYLFAAGAKRSSSAAGPLASALAPPGRFHLWETGRWRSQSWDVPAGGRVVAACWAGGGSSASASASAPSSSSSGPVAPLLIAMSHASSLVALHLVGGPGTLAEQLLPVALPGVSDVCKAGVGRSGVVGGGAGGVGASSSSSSPDGGCIADLAWDPSARRLAVALRAPHPAAGCVALYATRAAPVVSAQLVGFLRPFDDLEEGGAGLEGGGALSRWGAGLRVAFAPAPLLAQRHGDGDGGDDSYAPSAAGGQPAAILSVRDLLKKGGEAAGDEGEEGGERDGGAERIANIALHF